MFANLLPGLYNLTCCYELPEEGSRNLVSTKVTGVLLVTLHGQYKQFCILFLCIFNAFVEYIVSFFPILYLLWLFIAFKYLVWNIFLKVNWSIVKKKAFMTGRCLAWVSIQNLWCYVFFFGMPKVFIYWLILNKI